MEAGCECIECAPCAIHLAAHQCVGNIAGIPVYPLRLRKTGKIHRHASISEARGTAKSTDQVSERKRPGYRRPLSQRFSFPRKGETRYENWKRTRIGSKRRVRQVCKEESRSSASRGRDFSAPNSRWRWMAMHECFFLVFIGHNWSFFGLVVNMGSSPLCLAIWSLLTRPHCGAYSRESVVVIDSSAHIAHTSW